MAVPLLGLLALQCTDSTGTDSVGQLRIHPVFADGQDPGTLGVSVQSMHLVLRRGGGTGAVIVDTTLQYVPGSTTSWLVDLTNPPEVLGISGALAQGAVTFYTGTAQASVATGIGSSASSSDLPMQYIGTYQSFMIDISPDSADIGSPASTQQFAAQARDADGNALSGFSFTWSSSHPDVATVDPVTGLATAVGPGRTIIRASAGSVADSAVLVVRGAIVSLEVSPKLATVATGALQPFTATARNAQGDVVTGIGVTWTSEDPSIATVSTGGIATGVVTGTVKIIASAGAIAADTARLVVLGPEAAISIVPGLASIAAGATQQFTAVVRNGTGIIIPGVIFAWSSSDPVVATVNASGLAIGVSPGLATIAATAGGRSGTATLGVQNPAAGAPMSIVVSPPSALITALNGVQQFAALALDAHGQIVPGVAFSWSSSDPLVASVDATGRATAQSTGSTSIVATTGSRAGTASLSVRQLAASATVTPTAAHIALGGRTAFAAVAYDGNGFVVPNASFSWSTSDASIATVDAAGVVTGVSDGTVSVTARSGGAVAVASVTVAAVASIQLNPGGEYPVHVGGTVPYTAIAYDATGQPLSGAVLSWSSSDPATVSIDTASGLATALQPGVAQITATSGAASGHGWLVVQSLDAGEAGTRPNH